MKLDNSHRMILFSFIALTSFTIMGIGEGHLEFVLTMNFTVLWILGIFWSICEIYYLWKDLLKVGVKGK